MAAALKDKRTPITTPPYQVPSVDPPIFSLVTTFNYQNVVDGSPSEDLKMSPSYDVPKSVAAR
jgi:hypothetical protein